MIAADHDLDALFKRLHLANARRVWRDLVQRAEREAWTYRDFLTLLVTEEIAHRQQTRLARLTRRAHFPFLKTIDDFNFTYQSSLRLHMLGSALSPDFVTEGRSLIFCGQTGTREDASGGRHGLPRDPERLRCLLHDGGHAHRRPLGGLSRRRARARRCRPTRIRPSWSSTKSGISPTAPTRPICSFTSSTNGIAGTGR